jgi:hypothetical protein
MKETITINFITPEIPQLWETSKYFLQTWGARGGKTYLKSATSNSLLKLPNKNLTPKIKTTYLI